MNDTPDESVEEEPSTDPKERLPVEFDGEGQPRQVTLSVRSLVIGLSVVLLAIALGVGGYFVGKGTGEDLEAARTEGQAAGKKAGTVRGTRQGFKIGFREGRARGYDRAYGPAYKSSYVKAYEDAGLDAPERSEIEVPDP